MSRTLMLIFHIYFCSVIRRISEHFKHLKLQRFGYLLFLYSLLANALPSDKNQKINISSDNAIYNYKTGINIFEGKVKVDQGTSHILADKLITKSINHQLQEIIAIGNEELAHYWTLVKMGDDPIHAKAKTIKFYPIASDITLEKQVIITQGKNSFKGELIHYNSNKQMITVPPTKNGRAVIVYHPDQ